MVESDHEDDDAEPGFEGSARAKRARNQWTMLITTLVDAGVAEDVAIDRVASMTIGDDKATFIEMYGCGGINREANGARRKLNVTGLGACDLRTTKPDGTPWNFLNKGDRRQAMRLVDGLKPDFVIGSPPCTPFCSWNVHMIFRKMKQANVYKMVSEGKVHLELMCKMYKKQMRARRWLLHEHPATAVSWNEQCINKLTEDPLVQVVKADQCQYGLTSPAPDGQPLPALKPTKNMTNAGSDGETPSTALPEGS